MKIVEDRRRQDFCCCHCCCWSQLARVDEPFSRPNQVATRHYHIFSAFFHAQVSACAFAIRSHSRSASNLGEMSRHTFTLHPCRLLSFICWRVNKICRHLIARLLWVASFLCQVKIIEWFRRLDGPLGFPQWLICYYCISSRGDEVDRGEDEGEVTPALGFGWGMTPFNSRKVHINVFLSC